MSEEIGKEDIFKLYDIVTRLGKDLQIIIRINPSKDLMDFVCISAGGCFRIGDKESNLPRRYKFVRHGSINDIPKIQDGEFQCLKI